ncbi:MAG: alpha-amylase family glycosyl hydrolase [Propioniciclava sp.]|uniref:alpha-amylase family glycosyl hydrolase n=1 Tax=Propioniciclava sp. TaxID=2038686 RepID=UPI0039E2A4C2
MSTASPRLAPATASSLHAAQAPTPPAWLADGVIYEIYPQSFADSNGDGIGDLRGVMEHLDYLSWLGVDTLWFNPCFASPFRDAGYDVSDYLRIAPRYGTNDDLVALVGAAKDRGIRVLLDLVAGHTSIEHPWFQHSANTPGDDRYIWSARPGAGFVPSPGSRPGWYLKNFFDEQPALNFGYARLDPSEPWRQLPTEAGPQANEQALKDIIAFWLDRGVAGFRVDMAFSLVKDDPDLSATTALWSRVAAWVHEHYPDAALLPESDENVIATAGVRGGFDADFSLVIQREHSALFNDGTAGVLPWQDQAEPCYFDPHAEEADGLAALRRYLDLWQARLDEVGPGRLVVLPSADHDFTRLAGDGRTEQELAAAFTFLLTWGTVPSIYYGDEIGMRFLTGAPETEGSRWNPGYDRAGCRTPMQWDDARPNAGFSTSQPGRLYLPQDPSPGRPTVAEQQRRSGSLLHHVRALIALRKNTPELRTSAPRTVLNADYPLVYLRGDRHLVVVHPRPTTAHVRLDFLQGRSAHLLLGAGASVQDGAIDVEPLGHAVFELSANTSAQPGVPRH